VTPLIEEERGRADKMFELLCEAQADMRKGTDADELMARIEQLTGVSFCDWCDEHLRSDHIDYVYGETKLQFCDDECLSEFRVEWEG
jgi:hypothetical protein